VSPERHRPAYSQSFTTEELRELDPILPLEGITEEWAWGSATGRGVKVAVIDSGVDAPHPAVGHVEGYCDVQMAPDGGMQFLTEPHGDLFGHGTACAGIIRSLAPECEIYSVRVLGKLLTGKGAILAAGLKWAVTNGMHVCNMSLATPRQEFFGVLHELADQAYFRNTCLVTSANNMPIPSFPAMFASVISVASHDVNDPDLFYYNPSPPVEFGAHGIDVRVAWSKGSYMTSTGNSFATPHITGLVARILGEHPGLTVFQVKTILHALAANVRGTAAPEATSAAPGP
jgi:subtilisin family serine protease